ncbi:hypothetical protein GF415_05385 [Candidatus Micrarchaeota archaeon]|nr:hypothetical protein [Candidatus Micrarchaeota archaeon]
MRCSWITAFVFGLLVFPGLGFAAGCTEESYLSSCNECTFDEYGKMDEDCRKQFEENGRNCLITNQPAILFLYAKPEKCPSLSNCQMQFNMCKEMAGTGTDEGDCSSPQVKECFAKADSCISQAVNHCNAKSSPCAGLFILSTMAFVLISRKA